MPAIPTAGFLTACKRSSHDVFAMAVVVVLGCCIFLVTCSHVSSTASRQLAAENGPLENLQQLLLILAGISFAVHFFARSSSRPRERSLALTALCITFLLRETDVAEPDKFAWLSFWIDESGKWILLVATWLAVIFHIVGRGSLNSTIQENGKFDATFWILALAAAMLFVGWAFDRQYVLSANNVLFEEQSEVAGYALMLLASIPFKVKRPVIVGQPSTPSGTCDPPRRLCIASIASERNETNH